jgi:hypothetical protein
MEMAQCAGMQREYHPITVSKLIKHYAVKAYGGVDVYIHIFLTSALVWGECSASSRCRFTPRKRVPRTHWIGGWVYPPAGLDDVEKRKCTPPGLELRPLGRPARSQSLYRLSYPGSCQTKYQANFVEKAPVVTPDMSILLMANIRKYVEMP